MSRPAKRTVRCVSRLLAARGQDLLKDRESVVEVQPVDKITDWPPLSFLIIFAGPSQRQVLFDLLLHMIVVCWSWEHLVSVLRTMDAFPDRPHDLWQLCIHYLRIVSLDVVRRARLHDEVAYLRIAV